MNNDKFISEIFAGGNLGRGGMIHTGQHISSGSGLMPQKNTPINQMNNQLRPDLKPLRLLGPTHIPKAWQDLIIRSVYRRMNILVNVPPSAGKTFPLQKAYARLLSHATGPNNIPKILWVTETKLLASQISEELKQLLYALMTPGNDFGAMMPEFMMNRELMRTPRTDLPDAQNTKLDRSEMLIARDMVKRWTGVMMAGSANAIPPGPESIAITCSYSFASDMIKMYKPAIVVIDEVQERFKIENISAAAEAEKVMHFFKNVELVSKMPNSMIAVLTGSMNHATSGYIIDYLRDRTGASFIPIDYKSGHGEGVRSGERNAANISVLPIEMANKEIPSLIIDQIKNKIGHNLITRFGKRGIASAVADIIAATPERNMATILGLKSTIPKQGYKTPDISPHETNTSTDFTFGDSVSKSKNEYSNERIYKDWYTLDDPILKKALAHGVGYIMGSQEDLQGNKIREYTAKDVKVVEELFRKGLIYAILATTSVGVGVNLKVRQLYMNTIDVYNPDAGRPVPMSNSTLAQLVHRVGRNQKENAIVYCNKQDLGQVIEIIKSIDPSQQVSMIPQTTSGNRISILDRFKYALRPSYQDTQVFKLIIGT